MYLEDKVEHRFKAKSRWFGLVYYALMILICFSVFLLDQPRDMIVICIVLLVSPMLIIPSFLKSEYVISNRKIIFQEQSTYYDLQGNREKDHKSMYISIDQIKRIERIKSWWSSDYLRLWINEYKIDSHVLSINEIDSFINVLKEENPSIILQ